MKLRHILGILRDSYCRTIGIEYMHIQDPEQRRWIQERVEQPHEKPPREEQLRILLKLNQAEAFETFLQTKFVGQKRFSLEGGETTIPLVDEICEAAAEAELRRGLHRHGPPRPAQRARQHRRQVLQPDLPRVRGQHRPAHRPGLGRREVPPRRRRRVHRRARAPRSTSRSPRTRPTSRPSTRCSRASRGPSRTCSTAARSSRCCRCCVHGDAAFAGQGVVAETLNLSQLRGYRTGGTIHVVVNNQVGFTTSPSSSRSSLYCTDVARMVQAPIFHVNGDDPEACIRVARLAFEYRQAFNKDVVIDLVCYRRRGHNEGDDPSYTQPLMYDLIEQKRSVRKLYTESLIGRGDITIEEAEQVLQDYQQQLERVFREVREADAQPDEWTDGPRLPREAARGTATTAISQGGAQADRRRARQRPRRLHRAPEGAAAAAAPRRRDHRRPDRLGHRRDPRVRLAAHGGPPGAAGRPGLAPRHVRVSASPRSSTARTPTSGRRCRTSPRTRRSSTSTTRCSRSTPRSASSTATRWPVPRRWCSGRRSSVTSSTAPRPSSTSTSPPARPSGASSPASCCCCRTATRARAPTTPRPASSGS